MNIAESQDFAVNTKSLRDVRDFARNIFDKSPILQSQKVWVTIIFILKMQALLKNLLYQMAIIQENKWKLN